MGDKQEKLIDGFLSNLRLMGSLIIDIMETTMKENPQILTQYDEKCLAWEKTEREKWVSNKLNGSNDQNLRKELYNEASKKIVRKRFPGALQELKKAYRLSHVLDKNGYSWDKFFMREEQEPNDEQMIRQVMDSDVARKEWRVKTIRKFAKYTYKFWPSIQDKDLDFFKNHLHEALPNSEYTDALEVLYSTHDGKCYVSDDNIKKIWRMLHGTIKTTIKYMYYSKNSTFTFTKTVNGQRVVSHKLEIDIPSEIEKWNVNLEVR